MHIEHLMTFAAVANLRSFTRAAQVLSLSQSAVSQQIKELEQYFGQALLERTTRRLALTPAGERLLARATDMIAQLKATREEIGSFEGRPGGLLAIGCTTTIAIYRLPAMVAGLQRETALLRLSVRVGALPELQQGLVAGDLEVALATQQIPGPLRPEYSHEVFADDELTMFVKAGHRWAASGIVDPGEIAGEPLVARQEGSPTRTQVFATLRSIGVEPSIIQIELGNTEAIKRAVEAGLGFGFASRCALEREIHEGRLVAVTVRGVEFRRMLWLITPVAARRTDRAEYFRRFLLGRRTPEPSPAG